METTYFGAGCFWGVEHAFQHIDGVIETKVGFMGGTTENPTYKQVCGDDTGHVETTKVVFDPSKVSYRDLVNKFFEIHDPTQLNAQGADIGEQYRSVIFYTSEEQKIVAKEVIKELTDAKKYNKLITTTVEPAKEFYLAEEYHQNYSHKTGDYTCGIKINEK